MLIKEITIWLSIVFLCSLWNSKAKEKAIYIFSISFVIAYLSATVNAIAILFIFIYHLMLYMYYKQLKDRSNIGILIILFSSLLISHNLIGFSEPVTHKFLGDLHYSYDLFIVAFILLTMTNDKLHFSLENWKVNLKLIFSIGGKTLLFLLPLAFILNGFKLSPIWKLEDISFLLILSRIIIKAFAEEAFFRMFLFDFIGSGKYDSFDYENNEWLKKINLNNLDGFKIIASTILFALIYSIISIKLGLISILAGASYAYLYKKTYRVDYSILLNIVVNISCFIFFSGLFL